MLECFANSMDESSAHALVASKCCVSCVDAYESCYQAAEASMAESIEFMWPGLG